MTHATTKFLKSVIALRIWKGHPPVTGRRTAPQPAQTRPCHGPAAAVWIGHTNGPRSRLEVWTCTRCATTWTTPGQPLDPTVEATR